MGLFNRKSSDTPEEREYQAAKKALADDPVNRGKCGYVSQDSPEGRRNLAAQERLNRAERNRR